MHRNEKTEHLRNNIRYLIKSRGETQLSLSLSSGLTRSTIYNILDGRVTNVQQSTIRKISDFFGVSYQEIETVNFEQKETIDSSLSLEGNINPAAVPIIKERALLKCLEKKIGELCVTHPLTYYFGPARDLIAVLIENEIEGLNEPGDLLIINRGNRSPSAQVLLHDRKTGRLRIADATTTHSEPVEMVGEIIEERINDFP